MDYKKLFKAIGIVLLFLALAGAFYVGLKYYPKTVFTLVIVGVLVFFVKHIYEEL